MEISAPVLIAVGTNVVIVVAQFIAVKVDLKWIKRRLCAGDTRLDSHERRLNTHQARLAGIQSGCSARHGTVFTSVDNGQGDVVEGEAGGT